MSLQMSFLHLSGPRFFSSYTGVTCVKGRKRQQAVFNLTPAVCPKYWLQWYVCLPTQLQLLPSCRSLALTVFPRGRWPPWLCCDSHVPRLPRLFPHCHCGSYSITLKIKPFLMYGLKSCLKVADGGRWGRRCLAKAKCPDAVTKHLSRLSPSQQCSMFRWW